MNELSEDAKKLADLVNDNLDQLNGKCPDKIEIQDYYLGILSRQTILLQDLSKILVDRNPSFLTTPYVILRCILDDFLHLLYLELHENTEEQITLLNAKSHKLEFKGLKDLTATNYKYHEGKFPFYLTNEQFDVVKKKFSAKEENKRYFENIDTFKFKNFRNLSQVVDAINGPDNLNAIKDRAYYLWNDFSTFVHYANFAFYLEFKPDPTAPNKISESLLYCFNSINLSFKYFERTLGLKFIDNLHLKEKYHIICEC